MLALHRDALNPRSTRTAHRMGFCVFCGTEDSCLTFVVVDKINYFEIFHFWFLEQEQDKMGALYLLTFVSTNLHERWSWDPG